jgi:hypothetical protein
MASYKISIGVTPAKAGVQNFLNFLDSRFHGNDSKDDKNPFISNLQLTNKK